MNKRIVIDHDPATSSSRREDRAIEIQDWDREKGTELDRKEGLALSESYWEIIEFLRTRYIEKGNPESAREIARELEKAFADSGGDRMLRQLFPGGPVTQGSRIAAGMPVPAYSEDPFFGTTY